MRRIGVRTIGIGAFGIALAVGAANPAAAAAILLHHYDFNGSVTDSVGSMDGTLVGGATASGGALSLDGNGQYAQLSGYAVPSSNFSITFDATIAAYSSTDTVEMISQGYSGAGFYIGLRNGHFRLGAVENTGVAPPSLGVNHSYELVAGPSSTHFFIDGVQVYSSSILVTAAQSTTTTIFGAQFQNIGEYFDGSISNMSIYSGTLPVPEPEPATWTVLAVGLVALPPLRGRRRPAAGHRRAERI